MDKLIIAFMVFTVIVGMFSVFVVCRDVANEAKERKEKKKHSYRETDEELRPQAQIQPQAHIQPQAQIQPQVQQKAETAVSKAQPKAQEQPSAVASEKATEEAFETSETPERIKKTTDEVIAYAVAAEERGKNNVKGSEGYNRLVRLKTREGEVKCELAVPAPIIDRTAAMNAKTINITVHGGEMQRTAEAEARNPSAFARQNGISAAQSEYGAYRRLTL